jgi:hypothetical protein
MSKLKFKPSSMRSSEDIKIAQFPIADLEKSVKFNEFCTQAPTLADQQSLTRLHAFISEAVSWRQVAINLVVLYLQFLMVAAGFLHRTTKDVIWASDL